MTKFKLLRQNILALEVPYTFANTEDPDEMAGDELSHLDLQSVHFYL